MAKVIFQLEIVAIASEVFVMPLGERLLGARDYKLIEQFSLAAKRRLSGLATGEQRSPALGGGIEFADYREYQPGDDVRRIDWAVFLRLRRLLIKLSAEEKELTLMIILDGSRSMWFGQPDKARESARLAAILAGIALHGGNRAGILTLGPQLGEVIRPERSRTSMPALTAALSRLEPLEGINPAHCMKQFAAKYSHKCIVVLISDLLFPQWPQTLSGLANSGCEGYVLQMLAPEELDPSCVGEVTLVDLEDQSEVPLHIGRELTLRYRRELAAFIREIRRVCQRHGLRHTMVSTGMSLERVLYEDLSRGGLLC